MEEKQHNLPLKYQGYAIVLQEVPDEVTLAFNISGCPHKCPECHSKELWKYEGNYIGEDLLTVLSKYKEYISCVCFMGGDQNIKELHDLCKTVKENGLKTCIYSGCDFINLFDPLVEDDVIDYIKVGKYDSKYGGLDNFKTNQRMYKVTGKYKLECINSKFRKTTGFTKM